MLVPGEDPVRPGFQRDSGLWFGFGEGTSLLKEMGSQPCDRIKNSINLSHSTAPHFIPGFAAPLHPKP